jgi:hypothetical protein
MKSRKIFLLTICLTALVITGAASLFPSRTSAETECQKIQRINAPIVADFKARYADSSPAVALAAIQESDSKSLARQKFISLSPEKRKSVWRAKFAQIDAAKYAPARSRVIKKAVDLIETLNFDGMDEVQPVQVFIHEAQEVFDKDEVIELFASLSASPSLMNASVGVGRCDCSRAIDLCNEGYVCLFSPGMWNCAVQSWGCGPFWIYPCDGMCA